MLHLNQKHLDKSVSFITNMFTGMLNYEIVAILQLPNS